MLITEQSTVQKALIQNRRYNDTGLGFTIFLNTIGACFFVHPHIETRIYSLHTLYLRALPETVQYFSPAEGDAQDSFSFSVVSIQNFLHFSDQKYWQNWSKYIILP